MADNSDIESLLKELTDGQGLHRDLGNLIHYCQFLLDDEDMLTKHGNLNARGRELLQGRMGEVFGYETETGDDDSEDADAEDGNNLEGDA